MLNKIFLSLLIVSFAGAGILMFLSYSWLQSITNPVDVQTNYIFYNNLFWTFLWIASLTLLIFGNVILWKSRKSWALWTSFLFFAVFVIVQTWWIGAKYLDYKIQHNLTNNEYSLGAIFGTLICTLVAVGIFFNQFLVLRARDRVHGEPQKLLVAEQESELNEIRSSENNDV